MKVGDLVRIQSEWVHHNPWMKALFEDEVVEIGLIVKDYGKDNHHVEVLLGGRVFETSKTRLEVVSGEV